jgi:hypothetical protein
MGKLSGRAMVSVTPKRGLSMEEPDQDQHLPISFMSGFESRATFCGSVFVEVGRGRGGGGAGRRTPHSVRF